MRNKVRNESTYHDSELKQNPDWQREAARHVRHVNGRREIFIVAMPTPSLSAWESQWAMKCD